MAQFFLTNAGKSAAMNAATNSITIQIASIGLGKGKYDAGIAAAAKITLTILFG